MAMCRCAVAASLAASLAACSQFPYDFSGRAPSGTPKRDEPRRPDIVPTMVEPSLPDASYLGRPLGKGWYADTLTGSASTEGWRRGKAAAPAGSPALSVQDLAKLRSSSPDVANLLNASYLPDKLTDLALISRAAANVVANDAEVAADLAELETQGHLLAKVAKQYPADADFLVQAVVYQRSPLNAKAARAIRGDAAAHQELVELHRRVSTSQVGTVAFSATRALVSAQHHLRLKQGPLSGAIDALFVVRTPSFQAAITTIGDRMAAQRSLSRMQCGLLGVPCPDAGAAAAQASPPGCFALESDGRWSSAEVSAHRSACDESQVAKRENDARLANPCIKPKLVKEMSTLADLALRDPAYAQTLLTYISQDVRLKRFELVGSTEMDAVPAGQPFRCTMAGKAVFDRPGGKPDPENAFEVMMSHNAAWIVFDADPAGANRVKLRLTAMFYSAPSRVYVSEKAVPLD